MAKTKKINRRKKSAAKRNFSALVFIGLLSGALIAALFLEYLDFQRGRPSFLFEKLFGLKRFALTEINQELTMLLEKEKIEHSFFRDEKGIYHYRLDMPAENYQTFFKKLNDLLRRNGGQAIVREKEKLKGEELILLDLQFKQEKHFILLVHLLLAEKKSLPPKEKRGEEERVEKEPKKVTPAEKVIPRVAILIDDLGYSPLVTAALRELQIPLSVAVIPKTAYARQEAENAAIYGFEVLIHLPMQAQNGNGYDGKLSFVRLNSPEDEIFRIIREARQEIPQARGINNHTGSLATENRELMKKVLTIVKNEGLFFIDSRTSATSIAYQLTREIGLRSYRRDVFLDGVPTYANALRELTRLMNIALQNGKALAIGHPFQSTLDALREVIPLYKNRVRFVYVSNLLE